MVLGIGRNDELFGRVFGLLLPKNALDRLVAAFGAARKENHLGGVAVNHLGQAFPGFFENGAGFLASAVYRGGISSLIPEGSQKLLHLGPNRCRGGMVKKDRHTERIQAAGLVSVFSRLRQWLALQRQQASSRPLVYH